MTWEEFTKQAEASPFHWEIFGEYNDLIFEGYSEQQAYSEALAYGKRLEDEALKAQQELKR
jgi:hypothetical protein